MAMVQKLKIDETATSSNDNSDPNLSGKPPEEKTGDHSTSDEITPKLINGAPCFAYVNSAVDEDNGELLDDTELESEVISFIDEYQTKELYELDKPAVVLSKLRSLYKIYNTKIGMAKSINDGIATKYGIRKGMLLNIEKNLLRMKGRRWISHYIQTYGQKSLRTAQDYMALGKIPNIINYAALGKERLMGALRAIKTLNIEDPDPIAALFQYCGISFNPEEARFEDTMMDLKMGIDYAVATSKIKKAEEINEVDLGISPDQIKKLTSNGKTVSSGLINDLFEIKSEGRDVNGHLDGICDNSEDGDEMLPHIKKVAALPKLVEALRGSIESIRQHSALIGRVEPDYINDLENCVADLKNLVENQSTTK
jgi:hypothetical protein